MVALFLIFLSINAEATGSSQQDLASGAGFDLDSVVKMDPPVQCSTAADQQDASPKRMYRQFQTQFGNSDDEVTLALLSSKKWICHFITAADYQTNSDTFDRDYVDRTCSTSFTVQGNHVQVTFNDYAGYIDYTYDLTLAAGQLTGTDHRWYREHSDLSMRYDKNTKHLSLFQNFKSKPTMKSFANCY